MLVLCFLAAALALGEAQPGKGKGGCSRLEACVTKDLYYTRGTETYAECKSKLSAATSQQTKLCLMNAIHDTIRNKQCQCTPSEVSRFVAGPLTPSFTQTVSLLCYSVKDASLPECPPEVNSKCVTLLKTLGHGVPEKGVCTAKDRQTLQKIGECERVLKSSDLSKCGSIKDYFDIIYKSTLGTFSTLKKMWCAGCDFKGMTEDCTKQNFPRQGFTATLCQQKENMESFLTCFSSAVKKDCSALSSDIDALVELTKQFHHVKIIYESCEIEREFNYAEEYAKWGCNSSKGSAGKGTGPRVVPVDRRKRRTHDALQELWSVFTQVLH